jgi:hypothetical protein
VSLRVLLLFSLLLSACSQNSRTSSSIRIEPSPPRVGVETIYVHLPAIAGPVSIEADMTHPGMEPVVAAAAPDGAGGEYKGQLDLNMPGDWIIQVKAQSRDGRRILQQLNVTVSEK